MYEPMEYNKGSGEMYASWTYDECIVEMCMNNGHTMLMNIMENQGLITKNREGNTPRTRNEDIVAIRGV